MNIFALTIPEPTSILTKKLIPATTWDLYVNGSNLVKGVDCICDCIESLRPIQIPFTSSSIGLASVSPPAIILSFFEVFAVLFTKLDAGEAQCYSCCAERSFFLGGTGDGGGGRPRGGRGWENKRGAGGAGGGRARPAAAAAAEAAALQRRLRAEEERVLRETREAVNTARSRQETASLRQALEAAPKPTRVFSNESCPICLEDLKPVEGDEESSVTTLRCGHTFHAGCCAQWLAASHSARCPTCRTPITLRRSWWEGALMVR